MAMSITLQQGIPQIVTAGDSVSFSILDSTHLSSEWDATLIFKDPTGAVKDFDGVPEDDNSFLFELDNTDTKVLIPGRNLVCVSFEDTDSNLETGQWQEVLVLEDPTVASDPTFAQAQVTLLETVIARFNTTEAITVNFNGQSFTRDNVKSYQDQLTQWQSVVYTEKEQAKADRGLAIIGNRVPLRFVSR